MINYYLLTKPGIIFGNLVTFAAGFMLASRGHFDVVLFICTLIGLILIIASACVFNNYIDRLVDRKMERTKNRPLASGKVRGREALLFASLLWILGSVALFTYSNLLTVSVANIGFFVYVCLYSFLKFHTTYSTLIGSIAGAIPPVVGYCAVSNQFDLAAAILFLVLVFWQMPHFYSIALWHLDDYAKAGIPLLPFSKGIFKTKVHILFYILGFIPIVAFLTFLGYTGSLFLYITFFVGLVWLFYSIKGFKADCHHRFGKQMFRLSLIMINTFCLFIFLDKIYN